MKKQFKIPAAIGMSIAMILSPLSTFAYNIGDIVTITSNGLGIAGNYTTYKDAYKEASQNTDKQASTGTTVNSNDDKTDNPLDRAGLTTDDILNGKGAEVNVAMTKEEYAEWLKNHGWSDKDAKKAANSNDPDGLGLTPDDYGDLDSATLAALNALIESLFGDNGSGSNSASEDTDTTMDALNYFGLSFLNGMSKDIDGIVDELFEDGGFSLNRMLAEQVHRDNAMAGTVTPDCTVVMDNSFYKRVPVGRRLDHFDSVRCAVAADAYYIRCSDCRRVLKTSNAVMTTDKAAPEFDTGRQLEGPNYEGWVITASGAWTCLNCYAYMSYKKPNDYYSTGALEIPAHAAVSYSYEIDNPVLDSLYGGDQSAVYAFKSVLGSTQHEPACLVSLVPDYSGFDNLPFAAKDAKQYMLNYIQNSKEIDENADATQQANAAASREKAKAEVKKCLEWVIKNYRNGLPSKDFWDGSIAGNKKHNNPDDAADTDLLGHFPEDVNAWTPEMKAAYEDYLKRFKNNETVKKLQEKGLLTGDVTGNMSKVMANKANYTTGKDTVNVTLVVTVDENTTTSANSFKNVMAYFKYYITDKTDVTVASAQGLYGSNFAYLANSVGTFKLHRQIGYYKWTNETKQATATFTWKLPDGTELYSYSETYDSIKTSGFNGSNLYWTDENVTTFTVSMGKNMDSLIITDDYASERIR